MKSPDRNNFSDGFGGRRKNGIASRPIIVALVATAVLLIVQFAFPSFFPSFFSYFFSPVWSGGDAVSSDLTPRAQLVKENQALEQEVASYEAQASSSKALADENAELKSLLGRPAGAQDLTLANVIKRPPGAGYDYLVVDIGAADGVSAGDEVYSDGIVPIGQIVEADPHTSKVELYSSAGTTYDVLIGADHVPAQAMGQGGGSFSASVSRDAGVAVGDEVIAPAISSSPLGAVSSVISDPAQPFARILFDASVNPYESRFVLVSKSAAGSAGGGFVGAPPASTTPAQH